MKIHIKKIRYFTLLSSISVFLFIYLAIGSMDENQTTNHNQTDNTVQENNVTNSNNNWLIGIWSNKGTTNSGANMTLKLQLNPAGKGSIYMLDQWFECTYEIYEGVIVANRNGVDIQYSFNKNKKTIYMADGTKLYKQ